MDPSSMVASCCNYAIKEPQPRGANGTGLRAVPGPSPNSVPVHSHPCPALDPPACGPSCTLEPTNPKRHTPSDFSGWSWSAGFSQDFQDFFFSLSTDLRSSPGISCLMAAHCASLAFLLLLFQHTEPWLGGAGCCPHSIALLRAVNPLAERWVQVSD